MLYNFHDTPRDLFERMRLNVRLNEELGIRIWSFPMRFQPTNLPDRSHVGEHWTRYQLRSLQIILQATHGIVSGSPDFFKRAFGDSPEEFESLLLWPHKFIFNRDWYERYDGAAELDEFRSEFRKLDEEAKRGLLDLLSSVDPREYIRLPGQTPSKALKNILPLYFPMPKDEERKIWQYRRERAKLLAKDVSLSEDEIVEDAGLDDDVMQSEGDGK
jgi:hypothetical protein